MTLNVPILQKKKKNTNLSRDFLNCGAGEDSWESFGLQGNQSSQSQRKSTLNIQLERLMVKLKRQCFDHLMLDGMEKTLMLGKIVGKRRMGGRGWNGWMANSMDMNLSKLWEIVKDRGAWYATIHGLTKSWTVLTTEYTHTHIHIKKQNLMDHPSASDQVALPFGFGKYPPIVFPSRW